MSLRVLLVPSVFKGNGSGHIMRAIRLVHGLGPESAIFISANKTDFAWSAAELSISYARELEGLRVIDDLAKIGSWDLVVLDRRGTNAAELDFWENVGTVAALDEAGEARRSVSYLIDILPRLVPIHAGFFDEANRSSLGFLDLPRRRRTPPSSFKRILLSFGGEDPAGLALALARLLLGSGLVEAKNLTLVSGALRLGGPSLGLEGVTVLGPVQDLKEHLYGYDLVFTQFGLTAFEAAWAGCGVILLNPGRYHRHLSLAAGLPEIGIGRPRISALRRWFFDPEAVLERAAAILPSELEPLAELISGLDPSGPGECPVCKGRERTVVYRGPKRSYFRCDRCAMVYVQRFGSQRRAPYTRDYFFEEYRRQYGKTYLDDWPDLLRLAEGRIALIEELAGEVLGRREGLSLLDVGCAYGPFLAAAKARGHEPYGLDAVPEAARYVREELGIPAIAGDFIDPAVAESFGGPFDALSMWYVIEHFEDLDAALLNAAALVRPGGIFALSTPSGEGVSARSSWRDFCEKSPEDHFTVWEPSRVRPILRAYGFTLEKTRVTGHHPERFPLYRRLFGDRGGLVGGLLKSVLRCWSRLFHLGDTFEIYARRMGGESPVSAPLKLRETLGAEKTAKT